MFFSKPQFRDFEKEDAENSETEGGRQGSTIPDSHIVIEGPNLVKVVRTEPGSISKEEESRTHIVVHQGSIHPMAMLRIQSMDGVIVCDNGVVKIPLKYHKLLRSDEKEEATMK